MLRRQLEEVTALQGLQELRHLQGTQGPRQWPTLANGGWQCKRVGRCQAAQLGRLNFATNTECYECKASKNLALNPPKADGVASPSYSLVHQREGKGGGKGGGDARVGTQGGQEGRVPGQAPTSLLLTKAQKQALKNQRKKGNRKALKEATGAAAKPAEPAAEAVGQGQGAGQDSRKEGEEGTKVEGNKRQTLPHPALEHSRVLEDFLAPARVTKWKGLWDAEKTPGEDPTRTPEEEFQRLVGGRATTANADATAALQDGIRKLGEALVLVGADTPAGQAVSKELADKKAELERLTRTAPTPTLTAAALGKTLAQFKQDEVANEDQKKRACEHAAERQRERLAAIAEVKAFLEDLEQKTTDALEANQAKHAEQLANRKQRAAEVTRLLEERISKANKEAGVAPEVSVAAVQEAQAQAAKHNEQLEKQIQEVQAEFARCVEGIDQRWQPPPYTPPEGEAERLDLDALYGLLYEWHLKQGTTPFDWTLAQQVMQKLSITSLAQELLGEDTWKKFYPTDPPRTNVVPQQMVCCLSKALDMAAVKAQVEVKDAAAQKQRITAGLGAITAAAKKRRCAEAPSA